MVILELYGDVDMDQDSEVWNELEDLRSLGINAKDKRLKSSRDELAALADVIKRSMYQDYKLAYSIKGKEHEEEAKLHLKRVAKVFLCLAAYSTFFSPCSVAL